MTDLTSALDDAAAALLRRATGEGTVEGETPPSLSERVKAFEAAVKWAETRADIVQAPKEPSKFDGIRARVNGGAARGRRVAEDSAPETDS